MISTEALCRMIAGLDETELVRWVRGALGDAQGAPGTYSFEEIDVARVRLIFEMRQDFAIGDDAIPTVLSLLDQFYAVRQELRAVYAAIGRQPEEVRRAIQDSLRSQTQ